MLTLHVEETEVHAGDALTGWVRVLNQSRRPRNCRSLELRLQTGLVTRRRQKDWTVWRLRDDFSVAAHSELEVPFSVTVPDQLNAGMGELSAIVDPFRFSLVGPPVVRVLVRLPRDYFALVFALDEIGNSELLSWNIPTSAKLTHFGPARAIPGGLFVSRLQLHALRPGEEAAGHLTVCRMGKAGEGVSPIVEIATVPFCLRLEGVELDSQIRELLAPFSENANGLPVPAAPALERNDLPRPAPSGPQAL